MGYKETMVSDMMHSGEEMPHPHGESTIAAYAVITDKALREANLGLDKLYDNLFGARTETTQGKEKVPVNSLEKQMAMNADAAMITANRIGELIARMFG